MNFSVEEVRLDSIPDLERGDWAALGVLVGLRPAIQQAAAAIEEAAAATFARYVSKS